RYVHIIQEAPTTAVIGQTDPLSVNDKNQNPLVQGNTISVRVEGTKVKAVGNTSVTLDDTAFLGGLTWDHVVRGPGITEFTFRAVEDLEIDEGGNPTVETITILGSGPNGSIEIVLGSEGIAGQAVGSGDVMVEPVGPSTSRVTFIE